MRYELYRYISGWKNKKYVKQLQSILSYYALFIIGKLLVLNIETKLVSEELELIWHNKTETANRFGNRTRLSVWRKSCSL